MTALLIVLGGLVGAPARYLADLLVQSRHSSRMPWGTLTVNVVGSFVLGLVAGLTSVHHAPTWVLTLLGTGFCGALTTFSTFSFETFRLLDERQWRAAVLNVGLSVAAGLGAVALGFWVGSM
ncbi:fluoride efflux transporter CrcB [Nocardioides sp. CER19]|uniref:fluoride efflux transporter CrcB n=1 Tax=Nocardioides sp. CER19 TaxID=3038538 RepID=UPI002448B7F0|nr:fluoride efflux transporter CrcB [Nocardioides sp. CER19]MDH2414567.1 fluoride efflux transporter CrcB [Nocardioides sp. CER19]